MEASPPSSDTDESVARSRFAAFFAQAPFSLQIYAPDGTCRAANPAWERLWGVSRATLENYNILTDPNADAGGVRHLIQRAFAGEAVALPIQLYDPTLHGVNARRRWVATHLFPLKDERGQVREIVLLLQDVTEQKRTEEELELSLQRFRLAEQCANLGSFEWDLIRRKAGWTPQLERLYGIEPGQFDGTYESWLRFVHPEDRELVGMRLRECVEGDGELRSEYRVLRPDGSMRWILALGSVLRGPGGRPERVLGVNLDITDRKLAELELRRAIQARDEFLSIVSHELRTPLTSLMIQVESELIDAEQGQPGELARRGTAEWLRSLERQLHRLARQVDDMLDISRIATGTFRLERERLDLAELVRELAGRVPPGASRVEVRASAPVTGLWDRHRLEQLFGNLLSNAAKYGRGRPIGITVDAHGGQAGVRIRDQGVGIAPEDQARVFGKFERAVSDPSISGLGLGLYVARQIAEAHGGAIRLESRLGEGSVFEVILPRSGAGGAP